jgi:SNF2 family DNA or RNA helicase
VLGGEEVLQLPPKHEEEVAVPLGEAEAALYKRVHREAKSEWLKHRQLGAYHVSKNLLAIMSLLQPLRRICSGGLLTARDVRVGAPAPQTPTPPLPLAGEVQLQAASCPHTLAGLRIS